MTVKSDKRSIRARNTTDKRAVIRTSNVLSDAVGMNTLRKDDNLERNVDIRFKNKGGNEKNSPYSALNDPRNDDLSRGQAQFFCSLLDFGNGQGLLNLLITAKRRVGFEEEIAFLGPLRGRDSIQYRVLNDNVYECRISALPSGGRVAGSKSLFRLD